MTLTAFYDLEFGPVSFDFIHWLMRAIHQRDAGANDGLHAVVVPKENGVGGFARDWGGYDAAAARWRLWHIVVGACPLAGASLTIAASRHQVDVMRSVIDTPMWYPEGKAHFMAPLVDRARAGDKISLLRATPAAKQFVAKALGDRHKPLVTLTLRNHPFGPSRNTSAPDWARFGDWLKGLGYQVIVLQDTFTALNEGRGWAELDLDLRLALYEAAAMNCVGGNGPISLLWSSSAPYLAFDSGTDPDRLEGWELHGVGKGRQYPWAGPRQRLTYSPDRFDLMRQHFDEIMR